MLVFYLGYWLVCMMGFGRMLVDLVHPVTVRNDE